MKKEKKMLALITSAALVFHLPLKTLVPCLLQSPHRSPVVLILPLPSKFASCLSLTNFLSIFFKHAHSQPTAIMLFNTLASVLALAGAAVAHPKNHKRDTDTTSIKLYAYGKGISGYQVLAGPNGR